MLMDGFCCPDGLSGVTVGSGFSSATGSVWTGWCVSCCTGIVGDVLGGIGGTTWLRSAGVTGVIDIGNWEPTSSEETGAGGATTGNGAGTGASVSTFVGAGTGVTGAGSGGAGATTGV